VPDKSDGGTTLEMVEVVEGEHVAGRGTSEITWFVRQNDAWVHVSEWPGVEIERLDAGPGTVWQSRVILRLVRETPLMRVETRPAPDERAGAFEHLKRGPKPPPRHTDRRYYKVGRRGDLVRDSKD
jgi:hypothetical protein